MSEKNKAMTDSEFNRLLNGPLAHPLPIFRISRLSMALRAVVDATGLQGQQALREHCAAREESDERKREDEPMTPEQHNKFPGGRY